MIILYYLHFTFVGECAELLRKQTTNQTDSVESQSKTNDSASCHNHRSEGFGCDCGNCSLTEFLNNQCPKPVLTKSSFPYLDTANLLDSEKQRLRGRLLREWQEITCKYSSMKATICKSFVVRNVSVKELARVLADLGAFYPTRPQRPLLEDRLEEVENSEDVDHVFFLLREFTSFFSYRIIEHIAEQLGTDQDKLRVMAYKEEFELYARRNIFECPIYSIARSNQVNLVVKAEWDDTQRLNIKHLEVFQDTISRILTVSKYAMRLCSVEKGCVQLTFQVPCFLEPELFPLTPDQEDALVEECVTKLSVGNLDISFSCEVSVKTIDNTIDSSLNLW